MAIRLIKTPRFEDDRGWFAELYSERRFEGLGVQARFVQDNHSFSRDVGVLRGLHFQVPPYAQAKLVRCIRGRIWDVAVDVRRGSPTYGHWVAAELSPENGSQLYVPIGFAHGFVTLAPDTEVQYKVSSFYAPDREGGIRWDDPTLALPWPVPNGGVLVSEKDARLPPLVELVSPFPYHGEPLVSLED